MSKYIVGVDIGLQGAITIINNKTAKYIETYKMPTFKLKNKTHIDEDKLIEILSKYKNSNLCCEQLNAMPGQGTTSMFNFGYEYGFVSGISKIIMKNFTAVHPKKWQNFLIKKYFSEGVESKFDFYKIDEISNTIKDEKFKKEFLRIANLKSTKITKIKSLYLYYLIHTKKLDDINYKDNNVVDSYLIAMYYYFSNNVKNNI